MTEKLGWLACGSLFPLLSSSSVVFMCDVSIHARMYFYTFLSHCIFNENILENF